MDTNQYETRKCVTEPVARTYRYGSRVYGCHKENADFDYIVVVKSHKELHYSVQFTGTDITVYSEPMFIKKIKEHEISVLECIFQNENDPYAKHFELDLPTLRRAISAKSSNSFGKCKKKIVDGEVYIGKKSMFHSLRIILFGIQIARYGKIVDYTVANHFLDTIMKMEDDGNKIAKRFKPIFNAFKTSFRKLAPLEGE